MVSSFRALVPAVSASSPCAPGGRGDKGSMRVCAFPRDRTWITGEVEHELCEWGRESQEDEAGHEWPEAHATSCYP